MIASDCTRSCLFRVASIRRKTPLGAVAIELADRIGEHEHLTVSPERGPLEAVRTEPLVVGIAGGTCSGKSTLAQRLVEALGRDRAVWILQDSYYRHRPDLTLEERAAVNYDHPEALEFSLLLKHLKELRARREVQVPDYDFATHLRHPESRRVLPSPVIVVDGILLFHLPELRQHFDLRAFVHADPEVRFARRMQRDIQERGRTPASVIDQWHKTVDPMHRSFVEPSRAHAHVCLDGEAPLDEELSQLLQAIEQRGVQRLVQL